MNSEKLRVEINVSQATILKGKFLHFSFLTFHYSFFI
jgi:hypothetical protein